MSEELKQILSEVKNAADRAANAADKATMAADNATAAANGAREGLNDLRNLSIENHEKQTRAIAAMHRNLTVLWKRVHGSDPPPPADPNQAPAEEAAKVELGPDGKPVIVPSMPPLDEIAFGAAEKASQTSLELASLEGRMVNGFSAMKSQYDTAIAELKKQSSVMGVGKQGLRWLLGTREGWKTLGILVAGIAGIYAALRPHDHTPPASPQPIVVVMPGASASAH